MHRNLHALGVLAALCFGVSAAAQSTTVTASNLKMGGVPIAAGTVTITPTDAFGHPIAFTGGDGSFNGPQPYSAAITAGAIVPGFTVPDQQLSVATTPNTPLWYAVTVTRTNANHTSDTFSYSLPPNTVTGSTFALDLYKATQFAGALTGTTNATALPANLACTTGSRIVLGNGSAITAVYECYFGQMRQTPTGTGNGPAATFQVGTVSTGTAAVQVVAGANNVYTLNFTLPQGLQGATGNPGSTPSFSVGTVTTGAAGSSASVTVDPSSTPTNIKLDFVIPQGLAGQNGQGSSVALKLNGTNTSSQSVLNLIPGANVSLSDNGSGGITVAVSGLANVATSGSASDITSGVLPLAQVPDLSPAALYVSKKCAGKQVNLNTGAALDGTTATDFGPCINGLLSSATATNPVTVVLDGSFAVSGIYGPLAGYWSLVGLGGGMDGNNNLYGTGLYQIAGTNGDVIHNGSKHNYEPGQPGDPSTAGANVTIRDFVINGNRGNGTNGNNTSGDPRQQAGTGYPWTFGVGLHFLNHVRVSGMYFYNIATFNTVFDNIGDGTFDNNTCANTGANGSVAVGQNGDCWHVEGSSHDLHSSNVTCRSTDDCFALNAPEGPGGLIERVNITNWTMDARTCGRMYTNSTSSSVLVRNVSVSNINCKSQSWAIMFGQADAPAHTLTVPNSITNVRVSNSTFSGPFGFIISDSIGDLSIANTTVADNTCSHDGLSQSYCGFVQTATNTGITINHLALLNDTLKLTSTGSNAVAGALNTLNGWNSGSGNVNSKNLSITTLDISGFRVIQEGVGYGSIGQLITTDSQTSVLKLVGGGNDMSNIGAVTNAPASISYTMAPVVGSSYSTGTSTINPANGFVFALTGASTLQAGQLGQEIIVTNGTAGALNLSPASGATINGGSAAVAVAAGKRQILVVNPAAATDWLLVN